MAFDSLSDLAPDLLLNIVRHLSTDQATSQNDLHSPVDFVFRSNHLLINNFESVVALSSTCSTFRELLSPLLSSHLSLIRDSQIDALMASSSRLRHCSDKTKIQALYFGTRGLKYPAFGQFVSYLECDHFLLHDLGNWFPNVNSLKVLDVNSSLPMTQQGPILPLSNLAVNVLTLANSTLLIQSSRTLKRLDLLIDFYEASPKATLQKIPQFESLEHLNLIVTLPLALKFRDCEKFLSRYASKLSSLQLRLISSNIYNGEVNFVEWSSSASSKSTWLETISDSSGFSHLAIDETLLQGIRFPRPCMAKRSTKPGAFSLIRKSLGVPRFDVETKKTVANIISVLGSSSLHLNYGEVIDQSYVQALNALCDMVSFVNDTGCALDAASLEQCWSISGQALSRDYYLLLIRNPLATDKLQSCVAWAKMALHAPRYLTQETFDIDRSKLSAREPTGFESDIRAQFWSAETSLLELQQYSLQQKPPSGLWG